MADWEEIKQVYWDYSCAIIEIKFEHLVKEIFSKN